jgi:hypothetical protein
VGGRGSRRRLAVHQTTRPAARAMNLDLLVPPPWMERSDAARSLATERAIVEIPTTFGPSSCGQPRPWPCARDPAMVFLRVTGRAEVGRGRGGPGHREISIRRPLPLRGRRLSGGTPGRPCCFRFGFASSPFFDLDVPLFSIQITG